MLCVYRILHECVKLYSKAQNTWLRELFIYVGIIDSDYCT